MSAVDTVATVLCRRAHLAAVDPEVRPCGWCRSTATVLLDAIKRVYLLVPLTALEEIPTKGTR